MVTLSITVAEDQTRQAVLVLDLKGAATPDVIQAAYALGCLVGMTPSTGARHSRLDVRRPGDSTWRLTLHGVPDADVMLETFRVVFEAHAAAASSPPTPPAGSRAEEGV